VDEPQSEYKYSQYFGVPVNDVKNGRIEVPFIFKLLVKLLKIIRKFSISFYCGWGVDVS
jgi:hypothetical protein